MQFAFGAGNMYVTQLQDAFGNTVANPTPWPLAVLQDGSVDISGDLKELYGQNSFPAAAARGKTKVQIKVKPARIFAGVWNAIFFGQTLATGYVANFTDGSAGTAIPTTPFQITPTPPSGGVYAADLGVFNVATGLPFTRVASAPAAGQYSVNVATGVYTFASADNVSGISVLINFQYTVSSAGSGQKQTVQNVQMGFAPAFRADLTVSYLGKLTNFQFYKCVATKMAANFKNEDFMVPEFDFSAFDNGAGQVMGWSTQE